MKFVEAALFYSLVLFLPTQFGKHFWPEFSYIAGIRVDYLSPTLYFTDLLVLTLFAVWGYSCYKAISWQRSWIAYRKRYLFFSLFVLYLLLTIILAGTVSPGWYFIGKFLEFSFVSYYIATHIRHMQQIQIMMMLLSIGVIGESLLAFAQYLNQGSLDGVLYFLGERSFTSQTPGIANASLNGQLMLRPYGTFSHPNVLAGYLLVVLSWLLLLARATLLTLPRWFVAFTLFVGTAALLLTMSRVAIILWLFLLAFVGLSKARRFNWHRHKWIVVSGMAIILLLSFFVTPLLYRFLETSMQEEAIVHRQSLLIAAWQMFAHTPLFGVGLGNFLQNLSALQQPLTISLYLQPVHNIYVLLLAEIGLVGISLVLWFVGKTTQRLVSLSRKNTSEKEIAKIWLVLLLCILITGLFDHYWLTLQQGQLLLAFVIGLSWCSVKIVKSHFS